MGAFEAIIYCLPPELQEQIRDRLQLTAKAQVRHGLIAASCFSRCLSGEPHPSMMERPEPGPPRLKVIPGGKDAA
jgi:hypothetical protein